MGSEIQLYSNIAFVLQDGGILKRDEYNVIPVIDLAREFLKDAILSSHPDTTFHYLDSATVTKHQIKLSDIAVDEYGRPLVSATIGLENSLSYVEFGFRLKNGTEFSASYPNLAFYPPEE